MSITSVDAGVTRTTDLIAASSAYTATWWVYLPAVPSSGVVRTLYYLANSAARATEAIRVVQRDTGAIDLEVGATVVAGAVVAPGWHSVAQTRTATTQYLWVDGAIAATAFVAIGAWALTELFLGVDPTRSGAAQQVAYFREWTVQHFGAVIQQEAQSAVPVATTDLDTDTPLGTDLLDTTAQAHHWTAVGAVTFTPEPVSTTGAMGAWWFFSPWHATTLSPEQVPMLRLEVTGASAAGVLAEFWIRMLASEGGGDPFIVTRSDYEVVLRYWNGSTMIARTLTNPIPDPAVGYTIPSGSVAGPRIDFSVPWRWAIAYRSSTWTAATGSFAEDGRIDLVLNDTIVLTASAVRIPIRPDGAVLVYTVGLVGDCDRVWARTGSVAVPATTPDGAFVGGPPAGLLFFDEFEGGAYPDWIVVSTFPGGTPHAPTSFATAGGGDGWGLSTWADPPTVGNATHSVPYAGLSRRLMFPPLRLGTGPDGGDGGGGPVPPEVAPSYAVEDRIIRRLRRAPHVSHEQRRVFYRTFELDLERGVGLASGHGEDPQVLLRLSRDGGHTWSEPVVLRAGRLGTYTQRAIARRLGHARDAVFEVTVSDPVAWSLVQAWLDVEAGTS